MPGNTPFPIQAELTAISIAYRNGRMIADSVLPRVPVGTQEFKYLKHDLGENFTVPDVKVGRKSAPNKVEFHATELTAQTYDWGLDDDIPQADLGNIPPNYDPRGRAVEGLTDLIMLAREVRAAGLVFGSGNYAAGNVLALSGTSQWSDPASDPVATLMTGLDAVIMRPNVMVIGRPAWSILCRHPKLAAAIYKNGTSAGIVSAQAVADLLELDEVLIGEAWINSARKGQTASLARAWGKHCALIYRDPLADTRGRCSWGYTAQWGTRIAGSRENPNIGLRGGETVRAGESVVELVTASDLGYLLQNVVA